VARVQDPTKRLTRSIGNDEGGREVLKSCGVLEEVTGTTLVDHRDGSIVVLIENDTYGSLPKYRTQ
jgi:hypothetical protein